MTEHNQDTAAEQSENTSIFNFTDAAGVEHALSGRVLTGQGGTLELNDALRALCLLSDSGQFLVLKTEIYNPKVLTFKTQSKAKGYKVSTPILIEKMETIKSAYEADTSHRSVRVVRDETANQKEVLSLIQTAFKARASDLHVVAERHKAFAMMRVDGNLVLIKEYQSERAVDLCATAHSMTDASDPTYTPYEPQDARITNKSANLPEGLPSIRVAWSPLVFGGRMMVMRLLPDKSADASGTDLNQDLSSLGYLDEQAELIQYMRSQPFGINFFSGPVNSGKSTTMATILGCIIVERHGEVNVYTVEDPPEYIIDGARQIPVTNANTPEKRANAFQRTIANALRSDANVLMIGEIRDAASASLALQGALTGTLVQTSIHASSPIAITDRLRGLGVEEYLLFDPNIVTGLVGQRLVRLLCPHCKVSFEEALENGSADPAIRKRITKLLADLDLNEAQQLYGRRHGGCGECGNTGYKGRSVVAEVIVPDDAFMKHLKNGDKIAARNYWINDMSGMTMTAHAVIRMLEGSIGPIEIEQTVGVLKSDHNLVKTVKRWMADHDSE